MGSASGIKGCLVKYEIDKIMRELIDLVCKLAHSQSPEDRITLRSLIHYKLDRMRESQNGKSNS
jgi:hypothetical protein